MKFTIDSDGLAKRVKLLSKVANNNTIPILNNLLIEVSDNNLVITASDSENTLKTEVPVEAEGNLQKVCVDARTVVDALANISQQPITFTFEDNKVSLKYQNGEFNFACINAEEYPTTYTLTENETTALIPASILVENISRCIPFLAKDEIRPVLNCMFFDIQEENTFVVASDGSSLMKNTLHVKCDKPFSFILPIKPATLLKNIFGNVSKMISIRTNDTYAEFKADEWNLTCRLQEGRYPNYECVIPKNYHTRATIDKKAMVNAFKRVQPMANQASQQVKLYFNEGMVEISANDVDFATSAKENLTCDYDGEQLAIGVKGSRVLEILELMPGEMVNIDLEDCARPLLISPLEEQENQQILALQMPMLLVD